MVRKFNKKELCELIGVKPNGLKTIERRNQLEEKLSNEGYRLISRESDGSKLNRIIYTIEINDDDIIAPRSDSEILLDQMLEKMIGRKGNKIIAYYVTYLKLKYPGVPLRVSALADQLRSLGGDRIQIHRYIKTLVDNEVIIHNGYKYVLYMGDKITTTNYERYRKFQAKKGVKKQLIKVGVFYQQQRMETNDIQQDIDWINRCTRGKDENGNEVYKGYEKVSIYKINPHMVSDATEYIRLFEEIFSIDNIIDLSKIFPRNCKL